MAHVHRFGRRVCRHGEGKEIGVTDVTATSGGNEAALSVLERYLHPRMTSEHVNSGGGICMSPRIRSLLPGRRFVGRAFTARTLPGFTRRAIEALALAKAGDVLVVDAGGTSELSVWGSMVHWNAARSGLKAVVIDGMVRDLLEIESQAEAIPLFACGRAPAIAGFGGPSVGAVREPVVCGGVVVNTGDLIFGDDDGLAVVPWAKAGDVLDLAMRNMVFDDKEQAWIESGRSVYDLLVMLSGKDGSQYKERKFRWASQATIDPLLD
jgi:4-hydroxy-4-methyl-2-oxoglutarate aldolase